MEISQNFGGEYFYPLNLELPDYKLGTSGFTAVLGKLQRIREKSQSIRATPEYPGHPRESGLKPRESRLFSELGKISQKC